MKERITIFRTKNALNSQLKVVTIQPRGLPRKQAQNIRQSNQNHQINNFAFSLL